MRIKEKIDLNQEKVGFITVCIHHCKYRAVRYRLTLIALKHHHKN